MQSGENTQETSRDAYYKDAIPTLGERQKAVYEALAAHGPMTDLEIAYSLHRPINTITPRMNEFVKLAVVEVVAEEFDMPKRQKLQELLVEA